MKKPKYSKRFFVATVSIILLILAIVFGQKAVVLGADLIGVIGPPTPIPGRGEEDLLIESTLETIKISEYIDLAEGMADIEKYVFIVRRGDGTYTEILVPSDFPAGDVKVIRDSMNLSEEDVIVYSNPLIPQITRFPGGLSLPVEKKESQSTDTVISGDNPYPSPTTNP